MKIDLTKSFKLRKDSWDGLTDDARDMYMNFKTLDIHNVFTFILEELTYYKEKYHPSSCDILINIFLNENGIEIITHNISTAQTIKRVIEISEYVFRSGYYISDMYCYMLDKISGDFVKI